MREHHITFKTHGSKGHTLLLCYPFDQEVDMYEVEHQQEEERGGDTLYSGWITQYFRTPYPLDAQTQQELRTLPDVEESDFNQEKSTEGE